MTVRRTADEIMERGGFLPTDNGPYVTELREHTRRAVVLGLVDRSPGTWGPSARDFKTGAWKIDAETRAKTLLAIEWRVKRGHTCRIESFDGPPWYWPIDLRTWRRSFLHIEWRMIVPWLGDLCRRLGMRYRIWRDRNLVNPYED
jgi:hypothetical protein